MFTPVNSMSGAIPLGRRGIVAACAVLLTLCATFTACYSAFASFAPYDDEGYMAWTVKSFLGGEALYDRVATHYGPFYYLYEWLALSLAGVPPGSDSMRLVSIAFWVGAALIAFLVVYRATASLVLAVCVHLMAFRAMAFIGAEPAHPQEACVFLLLALGLAAYLGNRTQRMLLMGALGGAMAVSKINLGVFVWVALTVVLTYAQPAGWFRRFCCVAVTLGALALPAVLMWDRRGQAWVLTFCILMTLSLISALLTVWGLPLTGTLSLRDAALGAGAFVGTIAAICCLPLLRGSTVHALFEWLILMPRRAYSQLWAIPANIHPLALAWAVAGLIFAVCVSQRLVPDRWLALVKLAFGACVLLMCATNRWGKLLNFATPFIWLVAARPADSGAPARYTQARALLAVLGVIQVLYAYPIAGSQVAFVTVMMMVAAGICFWDGAVWNQQHRRAKASADRPRRWRPIAVQVTAAVIIAALNCAFAWEARRNYESFSALNFPGARFVRVEPKKAGVLRAIVTRINSSCRTLVTLPGLFSFHLWTGKPSPPGLDQQVWMSLLDTATQDSLVHEIARDPDACVVYQRDAADLWSFGADVSHKPLVRFIDENFHTVIEGYGYRLMMRRQPGAQTAAIQLAPGS
jgi:hypothetical protein